MSKHDLYESSVRVPFCLLFEYRSIQILCYVWIGGRDCIGVYGLFSASGEHARQRHIRQVNEPSLSSIVGFSIIYSRREND